MRIAALALAQRALLLDARAITPYLLRGVLVSVMLVALGVACATGRSVGAPGLRLFEWLVYANFCFVTLIGIGMFSAVVTEEKENATLGLLQLAGFGGISILAGKSAGQLLAMALLLLVQAPFTLLAITLGGVSRHQILAAGVILFAHLLFVYALGLLASVFAPHSGRAARLCAVALLAYYLVPQVGMLLGATGAPRFASNQSTGSGALYHVSHALANQSALGALGATTATGYARPLLDTPVFVTTAMAVLMLVAAVVLFGLATHSDATGGLIQGPAQRDRRRRPRPAGNPFFWHDFEFLCGGRRGIVLRLCACAVLLPITVHFLGQREGNVLIFAMVIAVALDLVVQANRMFGEEIKSGTLSLLLLVSAPLRTIVDGKARACAVLALPPAVAGAAAVLLMARPVFWVEIIVGSVMLAGIAGSLVIMGLHLVVLLSVRLRHHSLAVTILLLFLGGCLLVLLDTLGWAVLCFLLVMVPAARALHPAIGRIIRQRAGE